MEPTGSTESTRPLHRVLTTWRTRTRMLELGRRTLIMGVVNITPDSFSDGGLYLDVERAIEHALQLLDEGADILDLGAESTRPGSRAGKDPAVSAEDELARLLPVLEAILKARPDTVISVDTYKSVTARAAVAAGAEIVNDVSGFLWDPEMTAACAELGCGVVLMHTRGTPEEWRTQARLEGAAVLPLVQNGLAATLESAQAAGIAAEAIVLDPGYGFGKRLGENYALLARQAELLVLGRPLLVGLSRKSFLGHPMASLYGAPGQIPAGSRETASVAALTAGILLGASIVRVHLVRPAVEAARVADAIYAAWRPI
ncbi:dihydropteroate synthase [Acidicapsa ligni]|uniref:dihydropteroate synthase n=1 Tax=Acidicapsa ligni TaxID=542300 RepID=UPI0021E04EBD|nr:dihydropteroate synthase [Acidicapsa ligni]